MAERPSDRSFPSPASRRSHDTWLPVPDAWLVGALVVIATVIRAHGISAANLWLDEANSWQVASGSWHALFTDVLRSPLGPLYFVLLKLWISVFGDSELALRSLSLVSSLALIPIVYMLGARLLSRSAALLACAVLALSPLELYFAQEARMYMLVSTIAAACVLAYAMWRGDEAARPRIALVCYALLGAALVFTHLVAGLLLVAINIDAAIALTRPRARGRVAWIVANAAIVVVVLAYLSSVSAGSAVSSQAWRTPMGVSDATRSAFLLPFDALHGQHFYPTDFWMAFSSFTEGGQVNSRFIELLIVQPLVLIVLVAAFVALRRSAAPAWGKTLLALVLCVPVLVVTLVSSRRGLEFPRYLLFVVPFLFLLLADGLLALRLRARIPCLMVICAAMILGEHAERSVVSRDSDYRATANLLRRDARQGDLALVQPREMAVPLRYYLRSGVPAVRGIAADGSLAEEAHALASHRTWLIIDYRSPLYALAPRELREALDAPVELDEYTTDATAGVRVALLNVR